MYLNNLVLANYPPTSRFRLVCLMLTQNEDIYIDLRSDGYSGVYMSDMGQN